MLGCVPLGWCSRILGNLMFQLLVTLLAFMISLSLVSTDAKSQAEKLMVHM